MSEFYRRIEQAKDNRYLDVVMERNALRDRLAQTEALLREARTVMSMAGIDADHVRRTRSGPNAAAAMQRRDKAWAVEAKIDRMLED